MNHRVSNTMENPEKLIAIPFEDIYSDEARQEFKDGIKVDIESGPGRINFTFPIKPLPDCYFCLEQIIKLCCDLKDHYGGDSDINRTRLNYHFMIENGWYEPTCHFDVEMWNGPFHPVIRGVLMYGT